MSSGVAVSKKQYSVRRALGSRLEVRGGAGVEGKLLSTGSVLSQRDVWGTMTSVTVAAGRTVTRSRLLALMS